MHRGKRNIIGRLFHVEKTKGFATYVNLSKESTRNLQHLTFPFSRSHWTTATRRLCMRKFSGTANQNTIVAFMVFHDNVARTCTHVFPCNARVHVHRRTVPACSHLFAQHLSSMRKGLIFYYRSQICFFSDRCSKSSGAAAAFAEDSS